MTELIGSIHRGSLIACVVAIAIAAPASAEDPPASKKPRAHMLEEFDTDGDGKISGEERQKARETRSSLQRDAMKKFDADGDGELSESERSAAWEARRAERETKILEKFDTDGDGEISKDERRAFNQSDYGKRRGRMLEKFDADGDGEISDDERQDARAKREKRGGKRAPKSGESTSDGDS